MYEIIVQLKLESQDGQKYKTDCTHTEGLLRIIQSIPTPKAEAFKRWLARVGYERLQEIENSVLASQCAREIYQAKGYPDDWIEKRMRKYRGLFHRVNLLVHTPAFEVCSEKL